MNKFTAKHLLVIASAFFLIFSCAKDVAETEEEIQRRVLNSYLRVNNYQDIKPIGDGIYIIDHVEGIGPKAYDSSYVFIRYSTKYLTGEYASSTYSDVAKLLGTYKNGNFYGSYVWSVGTGFVLPAIDSILLRMNCGSKTTAIIPSWMASTTTTSYSSTMYSSEGTTLIYEIEMDTIVDDIYKYEIEQLESFSNKYYAGLDSTKWGFYYKKIYDGGYGDTIVSGASIDVRYIGKLLDGSIFDTNIADTAKKYNIYNSSNKYDALSLTFKSDSSEFVDENDVVKGFAMAFTNTDMTYKDKCVVYFNSDLGYGSDGSLSSGKGVPPFYPMFFEIWIEEKD
jgi:FKBP-type peptidyl-prolyl cis-trans isomerase 2